MPVLHVAMAAIVFLAACAFQVHYGGSGRFMPSISADWAHHAATTRAVFLSEDFDAPEVRMVLNEFARYPRLAYHMAAGLARLFDLPPVYALTILIQIGVICCCFFFALRAVTLAEERRPPLWATCLFLAALAGIPLWLELGYRSMVSPNGFFSQLVSIAVAQMVLFLALRIKRPAAFAIFAAASIVLVCNIHAVGFAWTVAALGLMALGFPGATHIVRVAVASAIGGSAIMAFWLAPGAMEMVKIAGTGGHLRAINFINIADSPLMFPLCMAPCLAFMAWLVLHIRSHGCQSIPSLLWKHAGLLSICPLILASAATVWAKDGSNWYPVAKWTYLLLPEFFLALWLAAGGKSTRATSLPWWPSALTAIFLCQIPFLGKTVDVELAVLAEKKPPAAVGPEGRRYPGLHVPDFSINYYIARAILKIPLDAGTLAWLEGRPASTLRVGPAAFQGIPPTLEAGQTVTFRSGRGLSQRMLDENWKGHSRKKFVWAYKQPATIVFRPPPGLGELHLRVLPFLPADTKSRAYRASINGQDTAPFTLSETDPKKPELVVLKVPAAPPRPDGLLLLRIHWKSTGRPEDAGFAISSLQCVPAQEITR